MNCSPMQLYAQMQAEIQELKTYCKNEMALVESCFNIALIYWNKIKNYSESCLFSHEADEINFFKNIRPAFIAVLEYYTLYYQAILFKPLPGSDQLILYWIHQLKRIEIFYDRNRAFYHYYMSGQTDKDKLYFNRHRTTGSLPANLPLNSKAAVSYDRIAARILGYGKYREYVEHELNVLL